MNAWGFGSIMTVTTAITAAIVWIRYDFGPTWAVAALIVVAFILVGALEWLKTLSTMRAGGNVVVDAMEKIESGNIAQFGAIKEFIKLEGAKSKKDNEEYWREMRQQPQLEAPDVWTVTPPSRQLAQHDDAEDVAWS